MSNNRKALSSWQGDKQQFWKVPGGLSLKYIFIEYLFLMKIFENSQAFIKEAVILTSGMCDFF